MTVRHRGAKLALRALLLCSLPLLTSACGATRTHVRGTLAPLSDVYTCAVHQLDQLGYDLALQDSVGGLLQGRRQITGFVETARRGAARATRVVTGGLAGGARDRYDELTVSVYRRRYPQGNTIEVTAGMLVVGGDEIGERDKPTDEAIANARVLIDACAPRL